ncbi:DUF1905 domain-containing protein [Luteibaculum oceani]|uniref:DUF1905 domain-containing protein n=1 Tax=Luteibaculum oceani TaxID=1294296 RepID=UPI001CB9C458|nr:DUF1905 domain-containing protein [Luteibaculum oceani]
MIKYAFSSTLWKSSEAGAWYFVSLPDELSKEIRTHSQWMEEGWGRLKAEASIKDVKWSTAIWFDSKKNTYLLPIKAEIRKKLNLTDGVHLDIELNL